MIVPASDCALWVSFSETLSDEHRPAVEALVRLLSKRDDLFLREIQPAYSSVLVKFDLRKMDAQRLTEALKPLVERANNWRGASSGRKAREVEIPVCYENPLAADLPGVAELTRLTIEEVIRLHSSAEYTVCFFGFMPGFSYWNGLPPALAVPRLETPRLKVPAGSVGIGGSQTGIYPLETPGGWRIIGRTPVTLFDPARKPLCLFQLGDRVRIRPISLAQFRSLGGKWES